MGRKLLRMSSKGTRLLRIVLVERQLGSDGILLLSGGFETARNAISAGILELIN